MSVKRPGPSSAEKMKRMEKFRRDVAAGKAKWPKLPPRRPGRIPSGGKVATSKPKSTGGWFAALSPAAKAAYVAKHPNSKYARYTGRRRK